MDAPSFPLGARLTTQAIALHCNHGIGHNTIYGYDTDLLLCYRGIKSFVETSVYVYVGTLVNLTHSTCHYQLWIIYMQDLFHRCSRSYCWGRKSSWDKWWRHQGPKHPRKWVMISMMMTRKNVQLQEQCWCTQCCAWPYTASGIFLLWSH